MHEFDPSLLDPRLIANLMKAVVVPRPIALVATLGARGANAAPFSHFNLVADDPPMLMLSV